ncbi:hypothetical protein Pmani_007408 [Petrolisthes manimaculis]|uniref:Uncharacterized protein n=1 Tax=Petrolisthes manimaculis TaxID=1843537 RepID=A0AAE1Q7S5_9EUCA|nr:hypothetical protein Pmani_007408 [Petrolisthes manimaculis]
MPAWQMEKIMIKLLLYKNAGFIASPSVCCSGVEAETNHIFMQLSLLDMSMYSTGLLISGARQQLWNTQKFSFSS